MITENRTKHTAVLAIVFLYCILSAFFNSSILRQKIPFYGGIAIAFFSVMLIVHFKIVVNHLRGSDITSIVSKMVFIFILSMFWAYLIWGQSLVSSIITMASLGGVFPLITYFILYKQNISSETIVKAIIILSLIYTICYLLGLLSLPNPLFGMRDELKEDLSSMIEQRGVIRLNVPGADFIVMAIFIILTRYKQRKKYYLFLIPLIIILLMRGTRTPFFATVAIGIVYYLWQMKHKLIVVILCIFLYFCSIQIFDIISRSSSTSPIVKYIQLTSSQIERSNTVEEDIRIEMAKYIFTDFNNGNIFRIMFGNGIPGYYGQYSRFIEKIGNEKGYYPVDTAFTSAYTYFGIIGIIIYIALFRIVCLTKVPHEYLWAKLYVFYLFLISPTNCALIVSSTLMLAFSLYVLNKESKNSLIKI